MDSNLFMNYGDWLNGQKMPKGKRSVLLAAIDLFSVAGFDGTSTSQIAKKADVSQATIFKYFATKEDLLIAIIKPIIRNLGPVIRDDFFAQINVQVNLAEVIHFIVRDRYQFLQDNAQVLEILIDEMLVNEKIRQLLIEFLDNSQTTVEESRIMQLVRPELTIADVIRTIIGHMITYFFQRRLFAGPAGDEEAELQKIEGLICRSLQP